MADFSDFDRYCDEHGIKPGEEPAFFPRSRRAQWLRTWVWPMAGVTAGYAALGIAAAVIGYDGWQVTELTLAAMTVFTIAANMWLAWESTAGWPE